MSLRLIGIVIVLSIFLAFIGLNLGNSCNINFGFTVLPDTPVYLTAFASFVLGLLCAVPFAGRRRRGKKPQEPAPAEIAYLPQANAAGAEADSPRFAKKKWGKKSGAPNPASPPDEIPEI